MFPFTQAQIVSDSKMVRQWLRSLDKVSVLYMICQGNIYVADSQNDCIRKISFHGGVTTIAGGSVKQFQFVTGIAINKQGDLFVSDVYRIKKITPEGIVSTFAGGYQKGYADARGRAAKFSQIEDLIMDQQENIYVTDENRIRKITPQGIVSTIAGSVAGYKDGDGEPQNLTDHKVWDRIFTGAFMWRISIIKEYVK